MSLGSTSRDKCDFDSVVHKPCVFWSGERYYRHLVPPYVIWLAVLNIIELNCCNNGKFQPPEEFSFAPGNWAS